MPEEKRPKDNSAYMQEAFERAGRCKSAKVCLGAIKNYPDVKLVYHTQSAKDLWIEEGE